MELIEERKKYRRLHCTFSRHRILRKVDIYMIHFDEHGHEF